MTDGKSDTTAKVEVVRGVEGLALYINDTRVAGPKPWGGGTTVAAWKAARVDWILEALNVKTCAE